MKNFISFAASRHPAGKRSALFAGLLLSAPPLPAQSDILDHLGAFPERISVGSPGQTAADGKEGPKGITTADFDGDDKPDIAGSNLDGTITVLFGQGGGRFDPPRHIHTGAKELRSVLAADLNNDGKPDLATASFEDAKLLIFFNAGARNFSAATALPAWVGVRALASGDFDGDGIADLAAAGPGLGVRHFRGTGGGAFEIMGDLKRLSPLYQSLSRTRPVYALHTLRSRDGLRDDLLVTHFESPSLWVLSTEPADRSNEPPVDLTTLPAWEPVNAPVLLTEAQVQNANTLLDADGTAQPWVELLNKSATPVALTGWKLRLESNPGPRDWIFPPVTLEPGRFLVVFLSGKNRTGGPELHASVVLKENTDQITLLQPDGTPANIIDLPGQVLTGISRGLAPDSNEVKWFDLPSPGAENNAGESNIDDLAQEIVATLTITPREPAAGQSVKVRLTMPERPTGSSHLRNVWFSATPGPTELHHLMHRISLGVFEETLPPGAFSGNTPHRVLARLWDGSTNPDGSPNDRNDYTVQVHPGLDEPESVIAVAPRPGCLLPVASTPSPKVKSFEIGPIFTKSTEPGARADLVFVDEKTGHLRVHRAEPASARRFAPVASYGLVVEGLPRDVKLADTNADGWLDATVVKRAMNLVHTFKNVNGQLEFAGEIPTGASPRELVMADFTGDSRADAAVINRDSADISILPAGDANASGLASLDQVYAADGDVGALFVEDLNGDNLDDVLQLHRGSGEISVRYSDPTGKLGAPVFWPLGAQGGCAVSLADVNNDDHPDVITANLGIEHDGSISVLLGMEGGGFVMPPIVVPASDKLFALAVADFDNDGNEDIAAGLWDCRISFFHGEGDGTFVAVAVPVPFVNESRVMVAKDFDGDGDIDIAGAGYDGDMVTLENRGAVTAQSWVRRYYPPPVLNVDYAADRIRLTSLNDDKDADLIIGTARGVILYQGVPGQGSMGFVRVPSDPASGLNLSVSDVFTADIDSDGDLDMVTACSDAACVRVLSQVTGGGFIQTLQADVPSARYLATGDLDGDGKPDLVGTGDALWTVLSSRAPLIAPPDYLLTSRAQSTQVVINEVLGRNTGVPLTIADNGGKSDFIELFNGGGTAVSLSGWRVRVQSNQEGIPVDETWPLSPVNIAAKGRIVIVCSTSEAPMHTGFTLPAEGGTITLLKNDGSEADRVEYPHAQENVSWSRYHDGHPTFHADPIPSPGLTNVDNGAAEPEVRLTPPDPADLIAGQPLTFTARGRDDLCIVSMNLYWNRLDAPLPAPQRLALYDNGLFPDTGLVDGIFTGRMPDPFPAGAEVQFYLEAVDLSGKVIRLPQNAVLSPPGDPPVAWSFAIATAPTLEITEVCTSNFSLQRDETAGHPDYVRVRNTGGAAVDMSNIVLAKSPLAEASTVFSFPSQFSLPPGGEVTVFADGHPSEGPFHAPFVLDAASDDVSLMALKPSGARVWIHSLSVPEMTETDSRFLPLPGTNLRAVVTAGSDLTNWAGVSYDANGTAFATVHFSTFTGTGYRIEGDASGAPVAWTLLQTIGGNGSVITVTRPLTQYAALRVVPVPQGLLIRVDATIGGIGTAGVYGEARDVMAITLYYGTTDGGTTPAAWSNSVGGYTATFSSTFSFAWFLTALAPDTPYYYRLKAEQPGGQVSWSAAGTTFRTLGPTASAVTSLALTKLNPTNATVHIDLNPLAPPNSTVELLAGPVDASTNYAAWPLRMPATRITPGGTAWTAGLTGLARDTNYFVRARVTSSTGSILSAQRLSFRTPDAKANLVLNLRLSEIMYHPPSPFGWNVNPLEKATELAAGFGERDFEFVELLNASDESMNLTGLWFTGIDFDFPSTGAPIIPPGGFAVIAANPHAFAMRYGANIPLAGWTLHPFRNSRLSNGGETIGLRTADGTALFDIGYIDRVFLANGSSSNLSDGGGASLEYIMPADPLRPEFGGGLGVPGDYRESIFGGTPGGFTPDFFPPSMGYDAWKLLQFSPEEAGISGMNSDPDRDGLTNFAEYAHGTRPLARDAEDVFGIVVDPVRWPGSFIFPVKANFAAADAAFVLETSTNHLNWQPLITYRHRDYRNYSHELISAEATQIRVFLFENIWSVSPRKFWRLRITNQ